MPVAIVPGAAGLIGAETTRFFHAQGYKVVGVDNDMRRTFFGAEASTHWSRLELEESLSRYVHCDADISTRSNISGLRATCCMSAWCAPACRNETKTCSFRSGADRGFFPSRNPDLPGNGDTPATSAK